jgi:2-oxoglutarate dehydrogenase E2 component (dihydrolipoamide succinyltransferase)
MPFIIRAVVDGLKAFPVMNASVSGQNIIYRKQYNIGVAVALDWGLIVPVIKHADDLSLTGLTRALNDLATRARAKKLSPEEVQGGTFTITNPGVFGSLMGTPIINQPQVAILGVGAIEKRPKVVAGADGEDTIAIRTCAYFSISFDHRIIDGAVADQFLAFVKKAIETFPETGL